MSLSESPRHIVMLERLCPSLDEIQRIDVCRLLADELVNAGAVNLARSYLEYALRLGSDCGYPELPALHADIGTLLFRSGAWREALRWFETGWTLSDKFDNSDRVRLTTGIANQQAALGYWDAATSLYRTAMEMSGHAVSQCYAAANLAVMLAARGQREEALHIDSSVLDKLADHGDTYGYCNTLATILSILVDLERRREYEEAVCLLEQHKEHLEFYDVAFYTTQTRMMYELKHGNVDSALVLLTHLKDLLAAGKCASWRGWAVIQSGMWLRKSGQSETAAAALQGLLKENSIDAQVRTECLFELALCARDMCDEKLKKQLTRQCLRLFQKLGFSKDEIRRREERLVRKSGGRKGHLHVVKAAVFDRYLGVCGKLRDCRDLLARLAGTDAIILLIGESGTGKTMIAQLVHESSIRRQKPFLRFDCTCTDEGLIESLLFGHQRGAFTGAVESRRGLVALASGGTLFIDEVGELPLAMQGKLLTLLEEGIYRPVGSSETKRADVRFVVATNRDLKKEVAERRFRADLFYRLGAIQVDLPPLRDHPDDIPLLVRAFMQELNAAHGQRKWLSVEAIARLQEYSWPGNVRELKKALERGFLLSEGNQLSLRDLGIFGDDEHPATFRPKTLEEIEREHIQKVLSLASDNKSQAARMLGVKRTTLYSRMENLGM